MSNSPNRRNRAFVLYLLAAACLLSCTPAHAQSKSSEPRQTKIVLRILNGKTGWPMWAELPNVSRISIYLDPPKTKISRVSHVPPVSFRSSR